MTREEAKGNLIHAIRWNDMPKKEALEMAIKALKQEPCEDCISRQAAIDALYHVDEYNGRSIQAIKNLPPVTPQQKTGQWSRVTDKYGHLVWECECGWKQRLHTNYCPDCGAKMAKSEEKV